MVGLREDESPPGGGQPTDAQSLSITVGLDHRIQNLRNAHPVLLMHQQRDIIDPFRVNLYFCHSGKSLPQFCFYGKK